jgi:5-methylcytosine-specific restriction endonuclease McrA
MNCLSCEKSIIGHRRKYCDSACRPSSYKPKSTRTQCCLNCGVVVEQPKAGGRPRKFCSHKCKDLLRTAQKPKRRIISTCSTCSKEFESNREQKFCSPNCRSVATVERERIRREEERNRLYPNGERTTLCGWCKKPRTWKIDESVVNAFHADCSVDARRARYRIKTVKRQKVVGTPSRVSADRVLEIYGHRCSICGEKIFLNLPRTSKEGLTVDHVIPISRGGNDEIANLRPAHWICNIRKSNKLPKEQNA